METTHTVAGHRLTLTAGTRYHASRPWAERGRTRFPVTINAETPWGPVAVVIPALTYGAANALINAFNNGATSFDGRVWK